MRNTGSRLYAHDENGNLAAETLGSLRVEYAYSPENRVVYVNIEVAGLAGRRHRGWFPQELKAGVRYEYDALGRRVSRTEYDTVSGEPGSWRRSWDTETNAEVLYDGLSMAVLAELRDTDFRPTLDCPWLPWTGEGLRPRWGWRRPHPRHRHWGWVAAGRYRPVSEYLYGTALLTRSDFDPACRTLTWKGTEHYHQDVLGSTVLLTDRHGHPTERYRYDAFGTHYEGSFRRVNERGYTGKRYDLATAAYDYGFLDYLPLVGRFTTVDPVRSGRNWYVYCGNDPISKIDPWGLRDLTPEEKELIEEILGDAVDTSKMQIEDQSLTVQEVRGAAASVGVTIPVSDEELTAAIEGLAMSLPNDTIYPARCPVHAGRSGSLESARGDTPGAVSAGRRESGAGEASHGAANV